MAEEEEPQHHLPLRLRGDNKTLWHTPEEREAWRACVAAAATAASLSYCAAGLAWHARGPLEQLGRKSGGKSGGKQKQAAAAQQAGSSMGSRRR